MTQFGPTSMIYRRPSDLKSARVFSDPPINTARVIKKGDEITLENKVTWRSQKVAKAVPDGNYTIGIRPHHITPVTQAKAASVIEGRVLVTELSGSESVVHFDMNGQTWVSQSHGIHPFEVGATAKLFVDVDQSFFFDGSGQLIGAGA